jgi:hypothetical protein
MWRTLLIAVALAGCVQMPPTPQDIQARRFESVPDKSVIYIVRDVMDNDIAATILLDDSLSITTYPGTYYRWETAPGQHRIAGFAADGGLFRLQTAPGRVYFVEQRLNQLMTFASSRFYLVSEGQARTIVARSVLIQ